MQTEKFNILDKFIAKYRLALVIRYIEQNDIVLDFGCGVQHYLLSSAKSKFKIGYGLDYDIDDCRKENIVLIKSRDNNKLPFEDNYIDNIFMLAVLEHIEKDEFPTLFSEFSRILKSNGQIIITSPTSRAKPILEFLAFKLKVISPGEIMDHKHYYNASEICELATASNLKLVKSKLFQCGLNCLYILRK